MAFAPSIYWPVDRAWRRERAAPPPAWEAQGNRYLAQRALGFEHAGSGSLTLVVPVLKNDSATQTRVLEPEREPNQTATQQPLQAAA